MGQDSEGLHPFSDRVLYPHLRNFEGGAKGNTARTRHRTGRSTNRASNERAKAIAYNTAIAATGTAIIFAVWLIWYWRSVSAK